MRYAVCCSIKKIDLCLKSADFYSLCEYADCSIRVYRLFYLKYAPWRYMLDAYIVGIYNRLVPSN